MEKYNVYSTWPDNVTFKEKKKINHVVFTHSQQQPNEHIVSNGRRQFYIIEIKSIGTHKNNFGILFCFLQNKAQVFVVLKHAFSFTSHQESDLQNSSQLFLSWVQTILITIRIQKGKK